MPLSCPPERALESDAGVTRASEGSVPEDLTVEEEELDELAEEVQQMAAKIQEYRATLPDQLKTTLASLLSSQRPLIPQFDPASASDPGPSGEPSPDSGQVDSSAAASRTEEDEQTVEKVKLLKDKVARNAASMPVILKRMKDCMSKIDTLESSEGDIHPAFKKNRPAPHHDNGNGKINEL